MPRSRPAPGKRPRACKHRKRAQQPALKDDWAECPPRTPDELIRHMHGPMNEAMALMEVLRLMGRGMTELGRDEGDAVLAVADAARDRLKIVDGTWIDFIQAVRW